MPTPEEMEKGCDGRCETVVVNSVTVNKSDADRTTKAEDKRPSGRVVEATGSAEGKGKG